MRDVLCLTGVLLLVPVSGFACSFSTCMEDFEVSSAGLTIPANAPVIMIDTFWGGSEQAEILLETENGDPVDISVQDEFGRRGWWRVEPLDGFEEDESYTLTIAGGNADFQVCGESPPGFKFTTGSVEPLPTSLGSLTASEVKREPIIVDTEESCSGERDLAYVDVELNLSAETKLWQGAILIETYVDDTRWDASASYGGIYKPGESWIGFGKDRVFLVCDDRVSEYARLRSLQEGTIEIKMTARILGTDLFLESETISVHLSCVPSAEPEPDLSEPQLEPQPDNSSDSGCSTTYGVGGWLALGLALFWVRRRRAIQPSFSGDPTRNKCPSGSTSGLHLASTSSRLSIFTSRKRRSKVVRRLSECRLEGIRA